MTAKKTNSPVRKPTDKATNASRSAKDSPAQRDRQRAQPGPDGGSPKDLSDVPRAKLNNGGSPKNVVSHQEQYKDLSTKLPKGSKPTVAKVHVDREVVSHQEQFKDLDPSK